MRGAMDMSGSAKFKTVPIIDVTKENVAVVGPMMRGGIIGSDFIAIDCELSGLGNRKRLNATDLEERYENTGNVAKTRSIISIGLSLFKLFKTHGDPAENPGFPYHVQTFNILTLCSEDYIVEPASLKFLVEHGFDFSRQYAEGLPYLRGNDRGQGDNDFVRQIFMEIIRHKKPIVLHNGFIDLVFLYQNLYAQLPQNVNSFAADLAEMFPNGIYDTKYLSDYVCRKPASFLEYIFRAQQRKNIVMSGSERSPHVLLVFPSTFVQSSPHTQNRSCDYENLFLSAKDWTTKACSSFSNHGHCASGKKCPQSHDIDLVVLSKEVDTGKNDRKRKRSPQEKRKNSDQEDKKSNEDLPLDTSAVVPEKENIEAVATGSKSKPPKVVKSKTESSGGEGTSGFESDLQEPPPPPKPEPEKPESSSSKKRKNPKRSNVEGHRAGFDAFMTGFSFATYIVHSSLINPNEVSKSEAISRLLGVPVRPEFSDLNIANRIYLVCKDIPFMVRKSAYSRSSLGHYEKFTKEP